MKVFECPEAAVFWLRSIGIKMEEYDLFLKKRKRVVRLDMEKAKKFAKENNRKPTRRRVCTHVGYDLIKCGKTNEEVWNYIQPRFNLSESKRIYPSWYRCRLRRLGHLSSATRIQRRRVEVRYE